MQDSDKDTKPLDPAPKTKENNTATAEKKRKLHLGLDLGTMQTCMVTKLSKPGTEENIGTLFPTIVGYPEDGILSGILPGNAKMLHGEEAIANELHLRLVSPLSDGVISDLAAAKSYLSYLRQKIDPEFKREVLGVIGIPAVADAEAKENLKKAAKGAFDGILCVPEPFLAALGMRDEERLADPDYRDPVSNSLFVDIGAGTTDFCIGESESGARVKVPVGGKPRKIEIGKQVGNSCNVLLAEVFESIKKVIAMASPQSVFSLLQNIILTGGGSRIRNIDQELQRMLADDGYEDPEVIISSKDAKPFVAMGAMKVAKAARDDQWIRL
jgi:rod shape-determining protein MreB